VYGRLAGCLTIQIFLWHFKDYIEGLAGPNSNTAFFYHDLHWFWSSIESCLTLDQCHLLKMRATHQPCSSNWYCVLILSSYLYPVDPSLQCYLLQCYLLHLPDEMDCRAASAIDSGEGCSYLYLSYISSSANRAEVIALFTSSISTLARHAVKDMLYLTILGKWLQVFKLDRVMRQLSDFSCVLFVTPSSCDVFFFGVILSLSFGNLLCIVATVRGVG
jgi:hypothetical protein